MQQPSQLGYDYWAECEKHRINWLNEAYKARSSTMSAFLTASSAILAVTIALKSIGIYKFDISWVFYTALVLNILSVLSCAISLYEPIELCRRMELRLHQAGISGPPLVVHGQTKIRVPIGIDRKLFFVVCEVVAYVLFALLILALLALAVIAGV